MIAAPPKLDGPQAPGSVRVSSIRKLLTLSDLAFRDAAARCPNPADTESVLQVLCDMQFST
jgi:hypothetical protein